MIRGFIGLIATIIFISCQNQPTQHEQDNMSNVPKTKSDSLYKEVMDGHEKIMAKMGELQRYQGLVSQQIDSLLKLKNPGPEAAALRSGLDSALVRLKFAESAMNTWMDEFDPNKAGNNESERIDYYGKEKNKVEKIAEIMEKGISQARQVSKK